MRFFFNFNFTEKKLIYREIPSYKINKNPETGKEHLKFVYSDLPEREGDRVLTETILKDNDLQSELSETAKKQGFDLSQIHIRLLTSMKASDLAPKNEFADFNDKEKTVELHDRQSCVARFELQIGNKKEYMVGSIRGNRFDFVEMFRKAWNVQKQIRTQRTKEEQAHPISDISLGETEKKVFDRYPWMLRKLIMMHPNLEKVEFKMRQDSYRDAEEKIIPIKGQGAVMNLYIKGKSEPIPFSSTVEFKSVGAKGKSNTELLGQGLVSNYIAEQQNKELEKKASKQTEKKDYLKIMASEFADIALSNVANQALTKINDRQWNTFYDFLLPRKNKVANISVSRSSNGFKAVTFRVKYKNGKIDYKRCIE